MVWMSRCTVKVLMFVCKLYVEVCDQLIFRQSQLKVQKGNGFFIELKSKFNVEGVSYSNLLRTRNSETFSVELPQLEMTGLSGRSYNLL